MIADFRQYSESLLATVFVAIHMKPLAEKHVKHKILLSLVLVVVMGCYLIFRNDGPVPPTNDRHFRELEQAHGKTRLVFGSPAHEREEVGWTLNLFMELHDDQMKGIIDKNMHIVILIL